MQGLDAISNHLPAAGKARALIILMTAPKERSTTRPNPVTEHLANAGAFVDTKLKGARPRVSRVLGRYVRPFLFSGTLEALAVGYDSQTSAEYPFGSIRLLPVFSTEEAKEAAEKLGEELTGKGAEYSDIPFKYYPTVRGEGGSIEAQIFQDFATGIDPQILDAKDLKSVRF